LLIEVWKLRMNNTTRHGRPSYATTTQVGNMNTDHDDIFS
jgi:hypothetical protein